MSSEKYYHCIDTGMDQYMRNIKQRVEKYIYWHKRMQYMTTLIVQFYWRKNALVTKLQ